MIDYLFRWPFGLISVLIIYLSGVQGSDTRRTNQTASSSSLFPICISPFALGASEALSSWNLCGHLCFFVIWSLQSLTEGSDPAVLLWQLCHCSLSSLSVSSSLSLIRFVERLVLARHQLWPPFIFLFNCCFSSDLFPFSFGVEKCVFFQYFVADNFHCCVLQGWGPDLCNMM